MGLFLDLPNKIKNSGFLILCVLLFFYFSFYTINGERGLLKYMYLSKEIAYARTIAAQYSAQNEAKYIATLKAVVNYKIDDQENIRDIEALRQNRQFNEKLQRMLDKLSNERTKDAKNRRVLKVLEQAGEEIYKILD